MIRRVLLACAFVLAAAAVPGLIADTRYALRAAEPIAQTLGVAGSAPALVLLAQERDCADAGEMIGRWDASRPPLVALKIIVVADDRAVQGVRTRLPLPPGSSLDGVDRRGAALVGAKLGYRATPIAIFLDARGRVLGSSPGNRIPPPEALLRVYES